MVPPDTRIEGSPSAAAAELVAEKYPQLGSQQVILAFASSGLPASDPGYRRAVRAVAAKAAEEPGVGAVMPLPPVAGQDPRHSYLLLGVRGERPLPPELSASLRASASRASAGNVEVAPTGVTPVLAAGVRTELADLRTVELITAPVVAVLLAAGLGSVGAAVLPLLSAGAVVVTGLGVLALTRPDEGVDMTTVSIAATVGLGLALDYALLLLLRYRRLRGAGGTPREAAARTAATAGSTAAWAGTAVLLTAACLLVVDIPSVRALAVAVVLAAGLATAAALTLVPALLVTGDRLLGWGPMPWAGRAAPGAGPARWARHLMRRPVRYAAAGTALLALAAAPLGGVQTGVHFDRGAFAGSDAGQALARMEADGLASVTQLALPHPPKEGPVDTQRLAGELRADPRVSTVTALDNGRDTTVLLIGERHPVDSPAAADLHRDLRDRLVPRLLPGQPVHLAGPSATVHDLDRELRERLWQVLALILLGTFALTLLLFRSLLVPLKAIALNLLCLGAAFGLLTLAVGRFADGTVNLLLPVVTVTLVFGLSMDYGVFLVHRIAERHRESGDNTVAVADGLRDTARTVSLAAGVMVVTFAGLLFTHRQELQQLGFVVAVAILLDATVVRLVLVPALMRLLGHRNWWLPGPLARLLPPPPAPPRPRPATPVPRPAREHRPVTPAEAERD
nr:MMPL family transporter [Streptomyces sp. HNM0574]